MMTLLSATHQKNKNSGAEALYDAERRLLGERDGRIGSRHGSRQGQESGVEADCLGGGALGKPSRPRLPCRPRARGSALGSRARAYAAVCVLSSRVL